MLYSFPEKWKCVFLALLNETFNSTVLNFVDEVVCVCLWLRTKMFKRLGMSLVDYCKLPFVLFCIMPYVIQQL